MRYYLGTIYLVITAEIYVSGEIFIVFDSSRFFDQIDYMGSFGAYFTFNSSSEMFSEKEIHILFLLCS